MSADAAAGHRTVESWRGHEVETLDDLLRPGLRSVIVGINPSPVSVAAGHYYQGALGRRLWQRLASIEWLPGGDGYEDDRAFAAGIGFTDMVKKPSTRAQDLQPADFEHGRATLQRKLERFAPSLVIFTFEKTAEVLLGPFKGAGFEPGLEVVGRPAFIMPGPYERAERSTALLQDLREFDQR